MTATKIRTFADYVTRIFILEKVMLTITSTLLQCDKQKRNFLFVIKTE